MGCNFELQALASMFGTLYNVVNIKGRVTSSLTGFSKPEVVLVKLNFGNCVTHKMFLFIRIENCCAQPKIDERQEEGESGQQVSSAAVLYKDFTSSIRRESPVMFLPYHTIAV